MALVGGVLPDASIYFMWAQAKLRGLSEDIIWRDLYYSEGWQRVGAITNSIPLFLTVIVVSWVVGGRLAATDIGKHPLATACLALGVAAVVHCLTDLPLHADDGHPHFWPLSSWIFNSPVSYWDPRHYGNWWSPLEIGLAVLIVVVLWRRFITRWVRALLVLCLSSYAMVMAYWFLAFS